ncbi:Asparagine--tRNA ligase [Nymphaea thermarum]|nr:Asparagine--tRNA ligase [Nymphaea thermarum]
MQYGGRDLGNCLYHSSTACTILLRRRKSPTTRSLSLPLSVNDGSCLSNMQCVINSDVQGYDQVLYNPILCHYLKGIPGAEVLLHVTMSDNIWLCHNSCVCLG